MKGTLDGPREPPQTGTSNLGQRVTYHVTVGLSGGVAAGTGPVGLGGGLRRVGLDQTPPVDQAGVKETEMSR